MKPETEQRSDPELDLELNRLLSALDLEPVPDAGFTDAFMKTLPTRRPASRRGILLGLGLGAGLAVSGGLLYDNPVLSGVLQAASQGQFGTAAYAVIALVLMSAACAGLGVVSD